MRLSEAEYREVIRAAKERHANEIDPAARRELATAIRKLSDSADRKRANNSTAARRGAIRTGTPKGNGQ